jgi:amino acid transporter/nucleotide-binding universal stress UspA family protein
MTIQSDPIQSEHGEITLARTLTGFNATMIGLGAMIGAGVFVLTGIASGEAGPAAIIAFALNGIVTTFTAFSYAELASSIPEAGGGYAFVKRAFPGVTGFVSGWMLWFAYTVACSLYAVGFGGYFVELLESYLPPVYHSLAGLIGHSGAIILFTLAISAFFVMLNVVGADVTGKAENIITLAKIAVLGLFIAFGLAAITRNPELAKANFTPLFPKGFGGVIVAMGLTFIAFEGYDLIATVSEEIKNPTKTIPIATFVSLWAAVIIYLLILFVSIGAVDPTQFLDVYNKLPEQLPPELGAHVLHAANPAINTVWEILGTYKETGIVRAAENFMPSVGVLIIVFGGLLSTMSALNATVMASSRVAFSMGRQRMLPPRLAIIHPLRRTPYIAVLVTGLILVAMAVTLPIEVVGSAASLLFLLSFVLVNLSMIRIRRNEPELKGFKTPLFPLLPILGVISNLGLAIFQFTFQPMAWFISLGWIAVGLVIYYTYTTRVEAAEVPPETLIVHEEVLAVKEYSVLLPLANERQARQLTILGSAIAKEKDGEVLALHVVRLPVQLSLTEGRHFLARGRPLMEAAIEEARNFEVPVHTMIRVGRHVGSAILDTARDRDSNLILLGWPGYTQSHNVAFGNIIDLLAKNPPCDIAVVRFRRREAPQHILIPTTGGLHAQLAIELAIAQAHQYERKHPGRRPTITLLYVARQDANSGAMAGGYELLRSLAAGFDYPLEVLVVTAPDVATGILREAEEYNLVVMGATEERLFEQRLFGSISEQIARECSKTVIMVKRHQGPVVSWLRRLLTPGRTAPN